MKLILIQYTILFLILLEYTNNESTNHNENYSSPSLMTKPVYEKRSRFKQLVDTNKKNLMQGNTFRTTTNKNNNNLKQIPYYNPLSMNGNNVVNPSRFPAYSPNTPNNSPNFNPNIFKSINPNMNMGPNPSFNPNFNFNICIDPCNSCQNSMYFLKFKNNAECQFNNCPKLCMSITNQWTSNINPHYEMFKNNQINICETCFRAGHCHISNCIAEKQMINSAIQKAELAVPILHSVNINNPVLTFDKINKNINEYFFNMDFVFRNLIKISNLIKKYEEIMKNTDKIHGIYSKLYEYFYNKQDSIISNSSNKNIPSTTTINKAYTSSIGINYQELFSNLDLFKNYYSSMKSNKIHLNDDKIYLSSDIHKESDMIASINDFDKKIRFTINQAFNITEIFNFKMNKNSECLDLLYKSLLVITSELDVGSKSKIFGSIVKNYGKASTSVSSNGITENELEAIIEGNQTVSNRIMHSLGDIQGSKSDSSNNVKASLNGKNLRNKDYSSTSKFSNNKNKEGENTKKINSKDLHFDLDVDESDDWNKKSTKSTTNSDNKVDILSTSSKKELLSKRLKEPNNLINNKGKKKNVLKESISKISNQQKILQELRNKLKENLDSSTNDSKDINNNSNTIKLEALKIPINTNVFKPNHKYEHENEHEKKGNNKSNLKPAIMIPNNKDHENVSGKIIPKLLVPGPITFNNKPVKSTNMPIMGVKVTSSINKEVIRGMTNKKDTKENMNDSDIEKQIQKELEEADIRSIDKKPKSILNKNNKEDNTNTTKNSFKKPSTNPNNKSNSKESQRLIPHSLFSSISSKEQTKNNTKNTNTKTNKNTHHLKKHSSIDDEGLDDDAEDYSEDENFLEFKQTIKNNRKAHTNNKLNTSSSNKINYNSNSNDIDIDINKLNEDYINNNIRNTANPINTSHNASDSFHVESYDDIKNSTKSFLDSIDEDKLEEKAKDTDSLIVSIIFLIIILFYSYKI